MIANPAVRRWAPWLIVVLAAAVLLGVGSERTSHPTLEQRTMHIAGEVRCPVCAGQSAAQSDTPASLAIKDLIRQKLIAGEPSNRIVDDLVASYGPSILEKPQASGVGLLVWALPIVAVGVAVMGLSVAFSRWRPRRRAVATGEDHQMVAAALGSMAAASPTAATEPAMAPPETKPPETKPPETKPPETKPPEPGVTGVPGADQR